MKNTKIQVLAKVFDKELQANLEVIPLKNGAMLFKNVLIKRTAIDKWGIYNANSKELISQYFLKRCALLAAKLYTTRELNGCIEIALLDTKYWSNYCDSVSFRYSLSHINDADDRFLIVLTRLEYCTEQAQFYKDEIFKRFNYAFS